MHKLMNIIRVHIVFDVFNFEFRNISDFYELHKCFKNVYTVFCRIHAPPQIDAPPKFFYHVTEVSSSTIYVTTQFKG